MPTVAKSTAKKSGEIVQIVGVIIDVEFEGHLPPIYNALIIDREQGILMLEVAQHLSKQTVRAIALGP